MKKVSIIYPKKISKIAPEIYGHFSEHIGGVFYDGLWVGKDSDIPNINGFRKEAIDKLRAINIPVLRWPGGCYAEVYNWRDGIGKDRPIRRNWWTKHDGRFEPNCVGTHEFVELCELIGAKPYFAVLPNIWFGPLSEKITTTSSPKSNSPFSISKEPSIQRVVVKYFAFPSVAFWTISFCVFNAELI